MKNGGPHSVKGTAGASASPAVRPSLQAVLAALVVVTVAGQMFFYTWCRVQCRQMGYEISVEMEDLDRLREIHNDLRIRLERLKSPERLARVAETELGLHMPRAGQKRPVPGKIRMMRGHVSR